MKFTTTLFIILISFFGNTQEGRKLKVEPIVEENIYQLDGGTFLVFGQSRVIIPIQLPENTVEWYYVFTSVSDQQAARIKQTRIDLFSQLARVIDETGTTSTALSMLLAPAGTSSCSVYLFEEHEYAVNFKNKVEQDIFTSETWRYILSGTTEAAMQGKQKITLTENGMYYLGIKAGPSPVIVKIEVVAVVDGSISEDIWTEEQIATMENTLSELFRENDVSSEGADELSECISQNITENYPPNVFGEFDEETINSILEDYLNACVQQMEGGELTEEKQKAMTYGNLGWEYYEKNELDKAIEYTRKSLELDNTTGIFKANMGLFYLIKGEESTAMDFYIEAIAAMKKDKLNSLTYFEGALKDIKDAIRKHGLKGYEPIQNELQREYEALK